MYAFLDAERLRGYHLRFMDIDEAQDFDPTFIPVVKECVSYKNPCLSRFGTSKTNDTTLELAYQHSSQSIWVTPCTACGFKSYACLDNGHILEMIDEDVTRSDICEKQPGTLCPGCRVPINPRYGWWEHRYPERAEESVGLHIPQIIMPRHFADLFKWRDLLRKKNGFDNYSHGKFLNEVLGEPYDLAHRLIGVEQLKACAVLGPNTLHEAIKRVEKSRYSRIILGVDWSGGGQDGFSRTAIAVVGFANDGRVDIFYGKKFPSGTDGLVEAKEILHIANVLQAHFIIHDYNGVGSAREDIIRSMGYPFERIMPVLFTGEMPGHPVINFKKITDQRSRGFYHLCKPRSYQHTTKAMCQKTIRTFEYNDQNEDNEPLLKDFTQLVEDYIEHTNRTTYSVRKASESVSDDFASAANYACWGLWHATDTKPQIV